MTHEEGLALLGRKIILRDKIEEIISFNTEENTVIIKLSIGDLRGWGSNGLESDDYNYEELTKWIGKFDSIQKESIVFVKTLKEKLKEFKV